MPVLRFAQFALQTNMQSRIIKLVHQGPSHVFYNIAVIQIYMINSLLTKMSQQLQIFLFHDPVWNPSTFGNWLVQLCIVTNVAFWYCAFNNQICRFIPKRNCLSAISSFVVDCVSHCFIVHTSLWNWIALPWLNYYYWIGSARKLNFMLLTI